jgi:hypothetical protein
MYSPVYLLYANFKKKKAFKKSTPLGVSVREFPKMIRSCGLMYLNQMLMDLTFE